MGREEETLLVVDIGSLHVLLSITEHTQFVPFPLLYGLSEFIWHLYIRC